MKESECRVIWWFMLKIVGEILGFDMFNNLLFEMRDTRCWWELYWHLKGIIRGQIHVLQKSDFAFIRCKLPFFIVFSIVNPSILFLVDWLCAFWSHESKTQLIRISADCKWMRWDRLEFQQMSLRTLPYNRHKNVGMLVNEDRKVLLKVTWNWLKTS